jgi:hypothetical protein
MVYGGRISYCLYLVHWVVRDVGMAVLSRDPAAPGAGAYTPGGALTVPVLIAVCFAGAAGLHHGVEEPARRRLVRLWGGRRAVEADSAAQGPSTPAGPEPTEEAATARWEPPVPAVAGRPWPLEVPPRPRAAASADSRLLTGDGRTARPRS